MFNSQASQIDLVDCWCFCYPNPSGMGAWRNSTETQQTGHTPRPELKVKDLRKSVEEARMQVIPEGQSKDPAESVRPQALQDVFSYFILHR